MMNAGFPDFSWPLIFSFRKSSWRKEYSDLQGVIAPDSKGVRSGNAEVCPTMLPSSVCRIACQVVPAGLSRVQCTNSSKGIPADVSLLYSSRIARFSLSFRGALSIRISSIDMHLPEQTRALIPAEVCFHKFFGAHPLLAVLPSLPRRIPEDFVYFLRDLNRLHGVVPENRYPSPPQPAALCKNPVCNLLRFSPQVL